MWTNFILLLCAQIFVSFGGLTIPPLIPFIQSELRFTYTQLGSIMTFLYSGALVMSLPAGWFTDRLGVKKMISLSQIFTGISVVLFSLTGNYLEAVIFAFITGLGYGMVNPPTTKGIMILVSPKNRGLAMSVKQTGVPIGTAMAAGLLPSLAIYLSWNFAFILAGILIIVSGLLSQILFNKDLEKPILFRTHPDDSNFNWKQIYKNRDIILLSMGSALCCVVQSALVTYVILYLRDVKAFDLITASFYLSLVNIGGILGRVFWGILSDRFFKGSRKTVLKLIVSIIFGISLILGLNLSLPKVALFFVLFIFGFSAIGWNGVYHAFIGELSGERLAGRAVGLSIAIAFLGNLSGPILFGKVIDATGGYNIAWYSLCLVMVGAFILFDRIREKRLLAQ